MVSSVGEIIFRIGVPISPRPATIFLFADSMSGPDEGIFSSAHHFRNDAGPIGGNEKSCFPGEASSTVICSRKGFPGRGEIPY